MATQVLKKLTFLDPGPLPTSSKRSGLQKPGSSNQEEDEEEALVSSEDKEIIEASLGSYWGFTGVARGLAGVALGSSWGLAGDLQGTCWVLAGGSLGVRGGLAGGPLDIQGYGRRPQSRRCKMMRSYNQLATLK